MQSMRETTTEIGRARQTTPARNGGCSRCPGVDSRYRTPRLYVLHECLAKNEKWQWAQDVPASCGRGIGPSAPSSAGTSEPAAEERMAQARAGTSAAEPENRRRDLPTEG